MSDTTAMILMIVTVILPVLSALGFAVAAGCVVTWLATRLSALWARR
jgi:hypothetical protein